MTSYREGTIRYVSCNICLEVDVTIEGFGTKRRVILARLPREVTSDYDAAIRYVLPFVAAVQHGDERALAEVARTLDALSDPSATDDEKKYDPTGFDAEEWLPKLLCRIGCSRLVVPETTLCEVHTDPSSGQFMSCPSCFGTDIYGANDPSSQWSRRCNECETIWGVGGGENLCAFIHTGQEVRALMEAHRKAQADE